MSTLTIPCTPKDGTSKLRRLKCYLRTVENGACVSTLQALWDYREMRRQNGEERVANCTTIGSCNCSPASTARQMLHTSGEAEALRLTGRNSGELHDALMALSPLDRAAAGLCL